MSSPPSTESLGKGDASLRFPADVAVDPACDGQRPGCAFHNPNLILADLPCGQRCVFPEETPGSPAWYGRISTLARESDSPIYVIGARGGDAARRSFARRALLLRDDFVGGVLALPEGSVEVESILPKGARRDARMGDKAGLSCTVERDHVAMERFYTLYKESCERIGIVALGPDFVFAEHARAPEAFYLLFAWMGEELVGGRLLLAQDGMVRIVEGSSRRQFVDAQPDAFLTREVLRFALQQGAQFVDFGITEKDNEGLRQFKRRMGFVERDDVVSLAYSPAERERLPEPPPRPAMLPGRVDLALLESCNFSCGFCYREPWVPELSTEQIFRKLDQIAALKHSGVALSGGEPTLRKDLLEVIRYGSDVGISDVQLHTNGWRAADPDFARRLASAGLGSAMVSLHSHKADVFGEITSTQPAYFSRTLAAIDNLRDAGVYVLLSHVINSLNYPDLPDYMRFVARRLPGVEVFVFFVYPSVKGAGHRHLYPKLSDVRPFWKEALEVVREEGLSLTVDNLAGLPLCMMEGFEDYSKWNDALELEIETDGEVDDHRVKAPEMRQVPQCAQCRWTDRCPGFWSDYFEVHGEDELVPVPPVRA